MTKDIAGEEGGRQPHSLKDRRKEGLIVLWLKLK